MTLGELKADLRKHGIRVIGTVRFFLPAQGKWERCVTYFVDDKLVAPYPFNKVHPLVTKTGMDEEEIHSEKVKALKRTVLPDWDEL